MGFLVRYDEDPWLQASVTIFGIEHCALIDVWQDGPHWIAFYVAPDYCIWHPPEVGSLIDDGVGVILEVVRGAE